MFLAVFPGPPAQKGVVWLSRFFASGRICLDRCLRQAIPDYRKERPKGDTRQVDEQDVEFHQAKLRLFMEEHRSAEDQVAVKKAQAERQRLANQYFCQAYDHGLLSGTGRGLDFYLAPRLVQALPEGCVRYFIEKGDEVDDWVFAGGSSRRSCLVFSTGERILEVPRTLTDDGEPLLNSLHTACDRGSAQWPCLFWLYYEAPEKRIRGFLHPDRWHKLWNLTKGALKSAGLGPFVTELLLITNLNCGPWHGDAFFDVIRGSVQAPST